MRSRFRQGRPDRACGWPGRSARCRASSRSAVTPRPPGAPRQIAPRRRRRPDERPWPVPRACPQAWLSASARGQDSRLRAGRGPRSTDGSCRRPMHVPRHHGWVAIGARSEPLLETLVAFVHLRLPGLTSRDSRLPSPALPARRPDRALVPRAAAPAPWGPIAGTDRERSRRHVASQPGPASRIVSMSIGSNRSIAEATSAARARTVIGASASYTPSSTPRAASA